MTRGLLITLFILIVFGLIVLSSAGIADAQKKFGSPNYYVIHQVYWLLVGLGAMTFFSVLSYKFWKGASLIVLLGALALMIMVFMPRFGFGLKGAVRWLSIGGFSFQPAEFLKLALVIYFASLFSGHESRMRHFSHGTAPFLVVMAFVSGLLVMQPDIGTLIVVSAIALSIYFFAGAPLKHILVILMIAAIGIGILVAVEPYRLNRIKAFMNPEVDPRGISYHVRQSMIAIGSGGLLGVGYGNSTQKLGFLPEVVHDSIFAVIAEELGLAGALFTVGLYLALCWLLIRIAKAAGDTFAQLFVMGVNVWIVGQALLNIAAISGVAPLTGIPLPLISYGGTSVVAILAGLGIVINIARRA